MNLRGLFATRSRAARQLVYRSDRAGEYYVRQRLFSPPRSVPAARENYRHDFARIALVVVKWASLSGTGHGHA